MTTTHAFKIVVDGETNTGKSCFIHRHRTGEFESEHIPTMGVEVHPLVFHTTAGVVVFKVWDLAGDLAGDDRFLGLGDKYYKGAQGLLAFCDLSRADETCDRAFAILSSHPGIPAVLCGSKCDLLGQGAAWHPVSSVPYYEVSARSNYNFEKPFLALARALMCDPALEFCDAPALTPPDIPIDPAVMAALRRRTDLENLETKVSVSAIPDGENGRWMLSVDVVWQGCKAAFVSDEPYLVTYDDWIAFTEGKKDVPLAPGNSWGALGADEEYITFEAALSGNGSDMQISFSVPRLAASGVWRTAIEGARAAGLRFA